MKTFGKTIVGIFAAIGAVTVVGGICGALCQVFDKKEYLTEEGENIEDIAEGKEE